MPDVAVTIDFHNTLVECDAWFELEVRTLVSSVLDWSMLNDAVPPRVLDRGLIDAEYRRLRLAIHEHGHELEAGRSVVAVLDKMGISLSSELIARAIEALMRDALFRAKPVPGAERFLTDLRAGGARLAIVSSAVHHPFLEWALERFGMLEHIDIVITSASSGYYKSRPEIYWAALARLGSLPGGAVHIGDSLRFDVGGAARAGMRTVWFDRSSSRDHVTCGIEPGAVVTDLCTAAASVLELVRPREGTRRR